MAHDPPPGVHIEPIPPGQTLAGLLAAGEIDVLYMPRTPSTFTSGQVRRLFADPRTAEERYFAATGIFPVMHVVVLRRELYEQRPWLARSRVIGTDFWTYGLAGNEEGLDTFLRYPAEQGLIGSPPPAASLFAPETLESYVILAPHRAVR